MIERRTLWSLENLLIPSPSYQMFALEPLNGKETALYTGFIFHETRLRPITLRLDYFIFSPNICLGVYRH